MATTSTLPIGRLRANQAAARLHRRCWNRLSAGKGAKGERVYDWALLRITPPADEQGGDHWLLVRRRLGDGLLAFYRCWSPRPVTVAQLVRTAGSRWAIEECFQAAKGEVGLDQHQVRRWRSWYRYTTSSCSRTPYSRSSQRTNANDDLLPQKP